MQNNTDKHKTDSNIEKLRDPGNVLIVIYVTIILFFLLLGNITSASAEDILSEKKAVAIDAVERGELLVRDDRSGNFYATPLLSQNVEIFISGMVANARVKQRFENVSSEWIEAVYVFPLPDESAVMNLRMVVGDKVIIGEIKEKQQAREIYEKAKQEGKKTSLLAQKRPNIFTMAVANIPPESVVEVEIEYLDMVRYQDNIFSYRFPMVVGPRYIPGSPLAKDINHNKTLHFDEGGWAADTDQVKDASQITPPVAEPSHSLLNPVQLSVSLAPGFAVQGLTSLYHGVSIAEEEDDTYLMAFNGEVFADRDFVVEYQAANGREISAALFVEPGSEENHMFLMLMPPALKIENQMPREVVFVLDISGSMAGSSIRQAKTALIYAISRLQSRDRFNVIVFNNTAQRLFPVSIPADDANKMVAETKISSIEAEGGTEIAPALQLALDGSSDRSRIKQVVFLTDGAVGNEVHLFSMIANNLGDARLFTVGIGSAPNSYFMTRAAAMGRGTFSYIGKIEEVNRIMTDLFEKLENPVISGMKLTTMDGTEIEMYPEPLPDLYAGEPVIGLIRSEKSVAGMRLSGWRMGKEWSIDIASKSGKPRPGIAVLWARKKIRSLMDALNLGAAEPEVRRQVVATALKHNLVSRYTSLVAVEKEVSRPLEKKVGRRQMKTNLPKGWQHDKVFGTASKTAAGSNMMTVMGVMLLLFGMMILAAGRRRTA